MIYSKEFNLRKGITAIIGSGGKTTLMYRLADELAHNGGSVIVCTTTHIMRPEHCRVEEGVISKVSEPGIICAGTTDEGNPMKLSAPLQSIKELAGLADYVLVEADGSKRLPLKAHNASEPVIPAGTQDVILVMGMQGIGKSIVQAVHRSELFCGLTGAEPEEAVTPKLVAEVFTKELLAGKYAPEEPCQYRLQVLLNQADNEERRAAAAEIAELIEADCIIGAVGSMD